VVDGDSLEGPAPVPVHEDGGLRVVEGQISRGKLLAADPHTELSTVEDEVAHETTTSVLHPDTLMVGVGLFVHAEDDVGQTGSLGDLPVNSYDLSVDGDSSGVDDEVTNLTVEVVLVGEPVESVGSVRIRLDHEGALEVGSSQEGGEVVGISNKLCQIVLNQRGRNQVSSRGEEDKSGSDGGRVTSKTTSASWGGDGSIDGGGIIGDSVSASSKIFDITIDGVVTLVEVRGRTVLERRVTKPVGVISSSLPCRQGALVCLSHDGEQSDNS